MNRLNVPRNPPGSRPESGMRLLFSADARCRAQFYRRRPKSRHSYFRNLWMFSL